MPDSAAVLTKARAEVESLIDDVVLTIENGVARPDGDPGFEPGEADQLRRDLRDYADAILANARAAGHGDAGQAPSTGINDAVDAVVATIGRGVVKSPDGPGFGPEQGGRVRGSLRKFAHAIETAAGQNTRAGIDAAVGRVVHTIRGGLFLVYGRASYAAITGDQLEAYLETFADAVLTVVERERARARAGGASA